MRAKRSIIWKIDTKELTEIVKCSGSVTEILRKLGFPNAGNNFRTLLKRLNEDGIDYQHVTNAKKTRASAAVAKITIPLEKILVENSTYMSTQHLKKRLLKAQLLENKCSECGLGPVWNKKPISLQLEHKNGIRNDHRIENLTILCPNCHSQTETFAGKRFKKPKKTLTKGTLEHRMKMREIGKRQQKVDWETVDVKALYQEIGSCLGVAKRLGNVSDNTVRKRLKRLGVIL